MLNTDLYRSELRDLECAGSCTARRPGEQGFMLLGLIVVIFLILLVLGVAAPKVAQGLRREQEVETIHRGNQFVRAVQMYYRKVGHYPGSMEQLEKTNNVRFLRQRYVDPMTGKVDWRVIHVGEAKTTVKGFFGKPLAGIAGSGLGSAPGSPSPVGMGSPPGSPNMSGSSPIGSPSSGLGSAPGSSTGSSGTSSGFGSSDSSSGTGGEQSGGPFVGVGLAKAGNSITVLNEQATYATWEFIYDPRIEQLKAKSSIFGGGMTSTNSSGLGSNSTPNSTPNLNPNSNPTPTPDKTNPTPDGSPNPPTGPVTDGSMGGSGTSTPPQ